MAQYPPLSLQELAGTIRGEGRGSKASPEFRIDSNYGSERTNEFENIIEGRPMERTYWTVSLLRRNHRGGWCSHFDVEGAALLVIMRHVFQEPSG